MHFNINQIASVSVTLFAIIDILAAIPMIISLKEKSGKIESAKVSFASMTLMIGFLFLGEEMLRIMGIDFASFAIAGSMIILIIAMEMILGMTLFKEEITDSGFIVPLAFPMIVGAGTMTTLLSLRSQFAIQNIIVAIVINVVVIYLVIKNSSWIEKFIGDHGLVVMRKAFGIFLLAIAIKLIRANSGI